MNRGFFTFPPSFGTLPMELRAAWNSHAEMDDLLVRLVTAMEARASGCWRLDQRDLKLVGFGGAADLTSDVNVGFRQATRSVSLDQVGLGIVKAAITNKPVSGRRDPAATGLGGSANWIAKFEANSSLAVPMRNLESGVVMGVLAISSREDVQEDGRQWRIMSHLAREMQRWNHSPTDMREP